MDEATLRRLLKRLAAGTLPLDEAVARLKAAPIERLGDIATLDTHRALRQGMPEVVLAERKTAAQVAAIARRLAAHGPLLVTRLAPEQAAAVKRAVKGSVYDPVSRTLRRGRMRIPALGPVAVCCAGTSDVPVCEEAVVTLEVMGVEALRVYDVGVAGIHRLLARRDELDPGPGGGGGGRHGGGAAERGGRPGGAAGDRGAHLGRLRRLAGRAWPRCWPCSTPARPTSPWSTSTTASAPASWPG